MHLGITQVNHDQQSDLHAGVLAMLSTVLGFGMRKHLHLTNRCTMHEQHDC